MRSGRPHGQTIGRQLARPLAAALVACFASVVAATTPADLLLVQARIYTAAGPKLAQALAVSGGRLVYVGDEGAARAYRGPRTAVVSAHGRLVVPGLVDAHLHPIDMIRLEQCDLRVAAKSLSELTAFVGRCIRRYHPLPGQWLNVMQWNSSAGNQPDAHHPTLRAALDLAAPRNPVQLMADDGHHGAFNSAALALAKDDTGRMVGYNRQTLAGPLAGYAQLVGVDDAGEPNGVVNESAREPMTLQLLHYNNDVRAVERFAERIPRDLNRAGITAILDAAFSPEALPVYEKLLRTSRMTMRVTLAQFFDPDRERTPDRKPDWPGMLARAQALRQRYADHPLLRADFVKLFADGGVEGNPFGVPPSPGNSPMLVPYLQPRFTTDAAGHASVTGYVDTDSAPCRDVRAQTSAYESSAAVAAFVAAQGFHPQQCSVFRGKLQHSREVLLEFARQFHRAGFNLHVHVIGDAATRVALDAIEAARADDGISTTRDSLAHVMFVHPDDIARIGRDRLYLAYTYSWATVELDYDMTVLPFLQHVTGNTYQSRHVPGSYFEESWYPVRATRDAGGVLVAGSDAPVATRDPQPFVNMAIAVTRRLPGEPALSPRQAISIRDVLDAYTINGARFLGRESDFGSLQAGKSADFVILDRDVLALGESADPDAIAKTRVLETWFQGRRVYSAVRH